MNTESASVLAAYQAEVVATMVDMSQEDWTEFSTRLRSVEDYMHSHDSKIDAWWREQWKANATLQQACKEIETDIKALDQWRQRQLGALAMAAFMGSALGALVGVLVL